MLKAVSPQKRVPLPLSNIPTADQTDPVAIEIDGKCRTEQGNFTILGSLTPRRFRDNTVSEEEAQQEYDAWKHKAFQPKRPQENSTVAIPSPPPAMQADTFRGKKLYLPLQYLFDAISSTGEPRSARPALFAFALTCKERNPMIQWNPRTELHSSIESRIQTLDISVEAQRERARQLMKEQIVPPSEAEQLEARIEESKRNAALEAFHDATVVAEFERRIAAEEAKSKREEEERRRIGEERLNAAREAAQKRKADRERRLQLILDQEEATRDELEAVQRVRARFEEEKSKSQQPTS